MVDDIDAVVMAMFLSAFLFCHFWILEKSKTTQISEKQI